MPFVIDVAKINTTRATYKFGGKTTCAVLAQQAKPAAGSTTPPKTRHWRRGIRVKTAPPGRH